MTLDANGFNQIISSYKRYVIEKKVMFLKQYAFFSTIPDALLLQIYDLTLPMVYQNNNVVYQERQPVKYIYFIKSGEVEISQVVTIEEFNKEELQLVHHQFHQMNSKTKHATQKRVKIKILEQDAYFGELELVENQSSRVHRAVCCSERVELLLLKREVRPASILNSAHCCNFTCLFTLGRLVLPPTFGGADVRAPAHT